MFDEKNLNFDHLPSMDERRLSWSLALGLVSDDVDDDEEDRVVAGDKFDMLHDSVDEDSSRREVVAVVAVAVGGGGDEPLFAYE
jgi:hypothetical protein